MIHRFQHVEMLHRVFKAIMIRTLIDFSMDFKSEAGNYTPTKEFKAIMIRTLINIIMSDGHFPVMLWPLLYVQMTSRHLFMLLLCKTYI